MQPAEIFAQMTQRVADKPGLVDEVGAVFQFDISGEDGGSWVVDLKNSPGPVSSGSSDEDASGGCHRPGALPYCRHLLTSLVNHSPTDQSVSGD